MLAFQNPITDIGIDMDGVMYPFMDAFKKYCVQELGITEFSEPTKWDFYEDWGITKENFNQMLRSAPVTHRLFASEYPMKHVREGWDLLREMGMKLHVITARPTTAWSQTADWLHDNGLVPDHLHFTHDKTILSYVKNKEAAMIDDHVEYYLQLEKSGILAVLHSQPWNDSYQGAIRARSLVDFANIVKSVNNREITWMKPVQKETPSSMNVKQYYLKR